MVKFFLIIIVVYQVVMNFLLLMYVFFLSIFIVLVIIILFEVGVECIQDVNIYSRIGCLIVVGIILGILLFLFLFCENVVVMYNSDFYFVVIIV